LKDKLTTFAGDQPDSPVGEKIGAKEGIGVGSCATGSGKNV